MRSPKLDNLPIQLGHIEGIASIKSSFALKHVRYKTALPLAHIEG